jgi:hypothetical protein
MIGLNMIGLNVLMLMLMMMLMVTRLVMMIHYYYYSFTNQTAAVGLAAAAAADESSINQRTPSMHPECEAALSEKKARVSSASSASSCTQLELRDDYSNDELQGLVNKGNGRFPACSLSRYIVS